MSEQASPNILAETTLSVAEAARRIPPFRRGKPTHSSTIVRWIVNGVRVPGGGFVRPGAAADSGGATIFAAIQEQLGLRLEAHNDIQMKSFLIESAVKPEP